MNYYDVTSYDGVSPQWTLDSLVDTLTTGQIYRFRMRARNAVGFGAFSSDLIADLTPPPSTPAAPERNEFLSTTTSITISWLFVADNIGL